MNHQSTIDSTDWNLIQKIDDETIYASKWAWAIQLCLLVYL